LEVKDQYFNNMNILLQESDS